MVLPAWKDLSPLERRSPRKIYERIRAEVNSTEDEDSEQEPLLYSISVSVKDEDEDPIGSAVVTLTDSTDSDKTYTGTTGSAGGCTITNVPEGTYNVTATATDYENYEGSEALVVDGAETLNITMTDSEE